jgi:hypothetical protein
MLSKIWERITNEPALILGAVQAALTLAVVFGMRLSESQIAAVLTFSGALLALLTRQLVVPVGRSDALAAVALETGRRMGHSERPPMLPSAPVVDDKPPPPPQAAE